MNTLTPIFACATRLADQSSETAQAMNIALIFMVGIVFAMLGLLIKIMSNFARRERDCENPLP